MIRAQRDLNNRNDLDSASLWIYITTPFLKKETGLRVIPRTPGFTALFRNFNIRLYIPLHHHFTHYIEGFGVILNWSLILLSDDLFGSPEVCEAFPFSKFLLLQVHSVFP